MAQQLIKMRIQFRRDTAENWLLNKEVIPAAGEPCFETDTGVFKIGDGITTYEKLTPINGAKFEVDGQSIVIEDGVFKLAGFDAAEVGAHPRKTAEGGIEWVIPATAEEVADLKTDVKELQDLLISAGGEEPLLTRIDTLENSIEVLTGTGEGSVQKQIDDLFAQITDDGVINTIKEVFNYVEEHGGEFGELVSEISDLKDLMGTEPVADQIINALEEGKYVKEEVLDEYITAEQVAAEYERVEYEIAYKPVGTLVDYRENEIRVMCPADTAWELQQSGAGSDANSYYIGFKAYAPAGAVQFKEDNAEIITDDTMHKFEGNDFAGIDQYGRKYSIVWLPVAKYADGVWTYYGEKSTASKYIGWHYSVEWYDENGVKIDADTIRINLSNEDCHNVVEPYYMAGVVKWVTFNGEVCDVVEGKVDIVYEDEMDVKASEEVTIAEDGTLGIGEISLSKIVQAEDEYVIFDGGGASM